MERCFDSEIQKARTYLMNMGTEAMRAVSLATAGLFSRDVKQLEEVFKIEQTVDRMNIAVDDQCLKLLALQSPVAKDLRLVVAMIKTNADIERIAYRALNLARIGSDYLAGETLPIDAHLAALGSLASDRARCALQSFMHLDHSLACSLVAGDTQVDEARDRMASEVMEYLKSNPENMEPGVNIILLARNFERIADHATNIAENAIFAISGTDIRHHGMLAQKMPARLPSSDIKGTRPDFY
jgi:phosphate transport system protein